MSRSRCFFSAVAIDNRVYAFGGHTDFDGGDIASGEAYDIDASPCGWHDLPHMPCPRSNFAAVAVGQMIYLLGGYYRTSTGIIGFDSETVECWDVAYDTTSQTWITLANSSYRIQFRQGHAAAVIGRNIYVVGGYGSGKHLDSLHAYNVDTKTWTTNLPPMPTQRTECTAVSIGSKIIVMGGSNNTSRRLCTVEAYDISSQKWSTLSEMNYERIGCTATVILAHNTILVVGGSDNGICELFDLNCSVWTVLKHNGTDAKKHFCAASYIGEGKVMVMGGTGDDSGGGKRAEIITLTMAPSPPSDDESKCSDDAQQMPILLGDQEENPTYKRNMNKKLLYMDAANFIRKYFPFWEKQWNIKTANKRVRRFCTLAKKSGFTLVAFLDDNNVTQEAIRKWRKRRESEVKKKRRDVPQGAIRLVGDMFCCCGIEVRYSVDADNDDTLAYYAHVDGAMVLSADRDFLRYRGTSYQLFKGYNELRNKKLVLTPQDGTRKTSYRDLLSSPPKTATDLDPFKCKMNGIYLRGSPSPVTELGNLHIHLRPLRAALYAHLDIHSAIEEEFPVLMNGMCIWDKTNVLPNDSYIDLLESPLKAVEEFGKLLPSKPMHVSDQDWWKHEFALRAIIAEICCSYSGSTFLGTLQPLILMDDMNKLVKTGKQKKKKSGTNQKERQVTHYVAWRRLQKTGETNMEKRERYMKLFPDMLQHSTKKAPVDWERTLEIDAAASEKISTK